MISSVPFSAEFPFSGGQASEQGNMPCVANFYITVASYQTKHVYHRNMYILRAHLVTLQTNILLLYRVKHVYHRNMYTLPAHLVTKHQPPYPSFNKTNSTYRFKTITGQIKFLRFHWLPNVKQQMKHNRQVYIT